MNYNFFYFLFASLFFLQCQPSDGVRLKKGMTISKSVVVSEDIFNINGHDNLEKSALIIEGNNIVIDFNGATLEGSNDKSTPDEFYGLGILVQNGKNITIKNLNIKGYKVGLKAFGIDNLKLENCDFSYNYRPVLQKGVRDNENKYDLYTDKNDDWTEFGVSVYFEKCNHALIKNTTITESRNGIVLNNCQDGFFFNNTIQFNSGTGISLRHSSNNHIMHNKLDWNVRNYWHNQDTTFSDASGILIAKQSSNNMIAYNSTTHCSNGIVITPDISPSKKEVDGSDNNVIYGNDFSYAVNNGIQMIYSNNKIFSNILTNSSTGISCMFSNNSMIMGNALENNNLGISIVNGQNLQIRHNEFIDNQTALTTSLAKPHHYASKDEYSVNDNISIDHNLIKNSPIVFNIRQSKLVKVVLNQFVNCGSLETGNKNENLIFKSNEENPEIIREIKNSSFLAYAPQALSDGLNTKLTNAEQGIEYILMNEYGTYSFRYPKLWLRSNNKETGEYVFAFLGPYGNFKLKEGINIKEISLKTGTIPSTIVVKKEDFNKSISLEMEFIGEPIETQFGIKHKKGKIFPVKWEE